MKCDCPEQEVLLQTIFQKGNYFDCMIDCMGWTDNNDRWSFMNQDFLISWINYTY